MRRLLSMSGFSGAAGAFLLAASALSPNLALAAVSCSHWIKQANGVSWRECKSDDGTVRCYQRSRHQKPREVVCR